MITFIMMVSMVVKSYFGFNIIYSIIFYYLKKELMCVEFDLKAC